MSRQLTDQAAAHEGRSLLWPILALAAAWFYLLVFIRLAVAGRLTAELDQQTLPLVVGVLALVGILTGFLLGRGAEVAATPPRVFLIAGAAAVTTPFASGLPLLLVLAAVGGFSVVALVLSLTRLLPAWVQGRGVLVALVGLGFGSALSTIPGHLEWSVTRCSAIAAVACAIGLLAVQFASPAQSRPRP